MREPSIQHDTMNVNHSQELPLSLQVKLTRSFPSDLCPPPSLLLPTSSQTNQPPPLLPKRSLIKKSPSITHLNESMMIEPGANKQNLPSLLASQNHARPPLPKRSNLRSRIFPFGTPSSVQAVTTIRAPCVETPSPIDSEEDDLALAKDFLQQYVPLAYGLRDFSLR